jgi:hypothetical protein
LLSQIRASIRMGGETPVNQLKHVWCTLGLGDHKHHIHQSTLHQHRKNHDY